MRTTRLIPTAILLAGLYSLVGRQRVLNWGARADEARAALPGDELLLDADGVSTRAISIAAPPAAVFPWLAQMGPSPRGGAYTYDWIENLLGLDMHSADRILPEFQHPELGEMIGYGGNRMVLERIEPERVLAWRSQDGNWVWSFVLSPEDGGTRLISRNRFRLPTREARVGMIPMEPASLVMEHKMLHGIRERAERLAAGWAPAAVSDGADGPVQSGRVRGQDRRAGQRVEDGARPGHAPAAGRESAADRPGVGDRAARS